VPAKSRSVPPALAGADGWEWLQVQGFCYPSTIRLQLLSSSSGDDDLERLSCIDVCICLHPELMPSHAQGPSVARSGSQRKGKEPKVSQKEPKVSQGKADVSLQSSHKVPITFSIFFRTLQLAGEGGCITGEGEYNARERATFVPDSQSSQK
jgi:hypothetical protein